ncbi:uncharacterized protein Dwil_GK27157 [Drosophila willistoni]|uniref:Uncharacterized protein n=1 Tax=Drosophila willistoni TaxID=7260 RepID=A0A0Q9X307_DROWI|nr:uncharacterized protein Dwil_GK27157 [Drosophila willistoni]
MDLVHDSIGILGVLAFVIVVAHSASQVVVNSSGPLVTFVDRGTNVVDTFSPGDGMLPLLDGERATTAFHFVRSIFRRLYILIQYFASSETESDSGRSTTNNRTNNGSRRSSIKKSNPRGSKGDTNEGAQNGTEK